MTSHAPTNNMPTVKECISLARDLLTRAGIEEARLNAELLMAHALHCERGELIGRSSQALDASTHAHFEAALARRLKREPIEYITGWREFYSRRFICTPAALIPRAETEAIVDVCKKRLPRDFAGPAIDLGTGCGALAITLKLEFPKLSAIGADISKEAVLLARQNAEKLGARGIRWLVSDWLGAFAARPQFALIVANPPYVDIGYEPIMQPEVRDHEPRVALFGGKDGFEQIDRVLPQAKARLKPGGFYCMEFAAGQGDIIIERAQRVGFVGCELVRDFAGIERVLAASVE